MTDNEFYDYLKDSPTITGIISHIKKWWSNEGYDVELQDIFDKVIELDKAGHWTPVEKQMPKEGEQVFVYLFEDSPWIAWVNSDGKWETEEFVCGEDDEPIVWFPLPKPYKGGKE